MLTLLYTQDANCEFCGALLDGSAFQCIRCKALSCTSCIFAEAGDVPRVWDRENRRSPVNGKPFLLADARLGRVF